MKKRKAHMTDDELYEWIQTQCVLTDNNCIEWTRATNGSGYGLFGTKGKVHIAHRWLYQYIHGVELTTQEFVLHSCDNRRCVNLEHLRVGTHQENVNDMIDRKRARCNQGENNPRAKLKATDIPKIRMCLAYEDTLTDIAKEYNVSEATINNIKYGNCWKSI